MEEAAVALACVCGILMVIPVYLLARWAFGRDAGLIAGLLAALHPELVMLSADVMTETVFYCLQGMAVVFVARGLTVRSWLAWIGAGLAAAGALWIRAEGIYSAAVLVGAGIVYAMADIRREPRRAGGTLARVGVAVILMGLAYSPYLLWVHQRTGRWHFTTKGSAQAAVNVLKNSDSRRNHEFSLYDMERAFVRAVAYPALPWLLIGLVAVARRRSAWSPAAAVSVGVGAIGCAAVIYAHMRIGYAVSRRYFLQGVVFLLPLAGYGLALASSWATRWRSDRRLFGRAMVAVVVLFALVLTVVRTADPSRNRRIGLRLAGEWIRETYGPGSYLMTAQEQPAFYAMTRPVRIPRDYASMERTLTEAPGRLLVLIEHDFEDLGPSFRDRLESGSLDRVAEFPANPGPGDRRVWVYRSTGR
jgi:4-amino-4-deoxy-L-arabinose transferase-like glycosyltransferase